MDQEYYVKSFKSIAMKWFSQNINQFSAIVLFAALISTSKTAKSIR